MSECDFHVHGIVEVVDGHVEQPGGQVDRPEWSANEMGTRFKERSHRLAKAEVSVLQPAEIPGFGENAGFELQLTDPTGTNLAGLVEASQTIISRARTDRRLGDVDAVIRPEIPLYRLDLDRNRAKAMGIPIGDAFSTVKAFFSRGYIGDFNKFGRVYRVTMQADAQFRRYPEDAALFHIRSSTGEMVPVTAVGSFQVTTGPGSLKRFNLKNAIPLNGVPGRGHSSGEAMAAMEEIAGEVLPPSLGFEWSGLSFQEARVAGQMGVVLALARANSGDHSLR